MRHQGTCRQVSVVVGAEESLAEPVPVRLYLPRHSEFIGLNRMTSKRVAWLENNSHHLGRIGADAHAVNNSVRMLNTC